MFIAVIRTVILYVFVILAIRLMGKRQISDMQPSELVVTMMISDIASLPMQNTAQPLLSGVVPVLVLVSLELTVSAVMLKSRLFRKLISGSPVVVIEDGRLLQRQLSCGSKMFFPCRMCNTASWRQTGCSAYWKSPPSACRMRRKAVSSFRTTKWKPSW